MPVPATTERNVTCSRARTSCAARSVNRGRPCGSFVLAMVFTIHGIAMLWFGDTQTNKETDMAVELMNPAGLPKPEVYRQLSIATGSKLVFLAGQVARDAEGRPVGTGDLAAQVEQCYLNIGTAMAEVGGSFDDV